MRYDVPSCESELIRSPQFGAGVFRYDAHPVFDRILWAYGFRPFFLLSASYAALSILAWAAFWYGWLELPGIIVSTHWHAHEMIFGFAGAALCGFLLTAVPEWTITQPRTGRWLAGLAVVWLAGRVAMWGIGFFPLVLVAAVNLALLPILAMWTTPALWRDHTRRHRSFVLLVPALWLAQLTVFLAWMGVLDSIDWPQDIAMRALNGGLHVFLIAIVLVFTRVSMVLVPLALEEQEDEKSVFRPLPPRRNLAVTTLVFFAIADFAAPDNAISGWIALAAAAAQLDRMADLHVGRVLFKTYLLPIYLVYGWLAAGLAGLGTNALFDWDFFAASRHALSLGAASTAVLAVFLVAGLRHTGRDVVIPWLSLIAVAMTAFAAVLRVGTPVFVPDAYQSIGIGVSSLVWAGAFVAFLLSFTRILLEPRADGQPG